jgi:hypothetical protein
MAVAYTLDYYDINANAAVKSFIVQVPGFRTLAWGYVEGDIISLAYPEFFSIMTSLARARKLNLLLHLSFFTGAAYVF